LFLPDTNFRTWPECWSNHTVCVAQSVYAVDYLEILGIMIGQMVVGIEGDWIGVRAGSMQNAFVMLIGTFMLVGAWGTSLQGWVACFAISLFVYGFGAGGEFPTTSTMSMERPVSTAYGVQSIQEGKEDRMHRGRKVQLTFLMQGWGQLFNQAALVILLLAFHHGRGDPPYDARSTQLTFRISYALIIPFTLFVLLRRWRAWQAERASGGPKRGSGYDARALGMVFRHYWPRLLATAGGWLIMDFIYYGNKIFQAQFIQTIAPHNTSVLTGWLYNLINIGVSMFGYYAAAAMVDNKLYGRRTMQVVGFFFTGLIFLVCAIWYDQLSRPGIGTQIFQFLYYFAGFWIQFGPNCTTVSYTHPPSLSLDRMPKLTSLP
jgi:MFS family permease